MLSQSRVRSYHATTCRASTWKIGRPAPSPNQLPVGRRGPEWIRAPASSGFRRLPHLTPKPGHLGVRTEPEAAHRAAGIPRGQRATIPSGKPPLAHRRSTGAAPGSATYARSSLSSRGAFRGDSAWRRVPRGSRGWSCVGTRSSKLRADCCGGWTFVLKSFPFEDFSQNWGKLDTRNLSDRL